MMIRGTRPHNSGLRFFIFIGLDFRICEEKQQIPFLLVLLQGHQSKRTDIEVLCEIIYAHGER